MRKFVRRGNSYEMSFEFAQEEVTGELGGKAYLTCIWPVFEAIDATQMTSLNWFLEVRKPLTGDEEDITRIALYKEDAASILQMLNKEQTNLNISKCDTGVLISGKSALNISEVNAEVSNALKGSNDE